MITTQSIANIQTHLRQMESNREAAHFNLLLALTRLEDQHPDATLRELMDMLRGELPHAFIVVNKMRQSIMHAEPFLQG